MIDVNKDWDLATARENWTAYSEHNLHWIEEPISADRPLRESGFTTGSLLRLVAYWGMSNLIIISIQNALNFYNQTCASGAALARLCLWQSDLYVME